MTKGTYEKDGVKYDVINGKDYTSWRSKKFVRVWCTTCQDSGPATLGPMRHWARKHVQRNRGHIVRIDMSWTRVYESEPD